MSGNYSLEGDVLVVSQMSMTEIGCDAALHDQDDWLAGFLTARPTAELDEPRLVLSSPTETLTLLDREVASPDRPLIGTQWVGEAIGDGSSVTGGSSFSLATVDFGVDGQVEAFSGCQHGSGAFTPEETTIAFTDFTYDAALCSDSSLQQLSDAFVFVLDGSPVNYQLEERSLRIDRAGRTLYFRAAD